MHKNDYQHHSTTPGLLKVSGQDAKKFLQGQLTCNMNDITLAQSRLSAHCNPQGRVLFLCRVFCFLQDYYLIMPQEMIPHAFAFLKKYAVFFKLELLEADYKNNVSLHSITSQEWTYFDIRKGIPLIYPTTIGQFLPHDLHLHQLEGLSWEKGCYTGQEIIARMQYKGKLKNHLYRARVQTLALPKPGAPVYYRSQQEWVESGAIVDCYLDAPQTYQLLLVANETMTTSLFAVDPTKNETWEWLI